jgi:ABC-2 type transport system permease protein
MFYRFNQVDGYTFQEVLLCFAIVLMAFSIAECFARGFDSFSSMIGNGEFDRIMVRPRNEVFQVLSSKIELSRIGRFAQAIIIFAYAIPSSNIVWTADKIMTMLLMILSGTVIFSSLFVVYASLCFFTTEGLEFMNVFTDGGREFGMYPFAVYGNEVLKFLTYVIPLALFQYYPFLYLIGRETSKVYMFLPLAGLLFVIPCRLFWRFGVRHYKSTGS